MIPYVVSDTLHLGPLPLHPWGVLCAIGFVLWDLIATRQARRLGYDRGELRALQLWGMALGTVFAHLVDVLFYVPEELLRRPWLILMFWERLSSMGGFIGCLVGGVLWKFFRWERRGFLPRLVRRAVPLPLLPMAEVLVSILPLGWMFARAGCAIIHDHPGISTPPTELFAVAFPRAADDGLVASYGPIHVFHGSDPRYDLGLLECGYLAIMAAVIGIVWLRGKRPAMGMFIAGVAMAYAPVRFGLDFLRATEERAGDRRLGGLTFAQWTCFALFAFGVVMVGYARRLSRRGDDVAAPVRARPAAAPLAAADEPQ